MAAGVGERTARLRFRLLGPMEVTSDGEPLALGGPRQRALLALLLLHANEVVPRERLIDGLWGEEAPGTATNALQVAVHGLRKILGAGRIETRGTGYELRAESDEIDLDTFLRLAERARTQEGAAAAATLDEALALWRGDALADLGAAPFATAEAARLDELRLGVVERRIDALLADGRHGDVVADLERLVADHAYHERFRAQLVTALYRSGRQADALDAYRDARRTLVEALGMEPGAELRALEAAILRQDPSLETPVRPSEPAGNLPAPATSLVGRRLELAAVTGLLRRDDVRLVTLTGPGGTGKTRLALAAAAELAGAYEDGVWFVDLAALDDADLVPAVTARALGIAESGASTVDSLASALRRLSILVVLDNFERVDAAAPFVSALLTAAPGLTVVVTSRTALRLSGEHEYPVPPLRLPDPVESRALDALGRNEAVALFVARAAAARHGFRLTAENAAAVRAVCVALDGLPLALELAAARCRTLAPQALLSRLEQRLDLLTGGPRDAPDRQRTLRATIEWSHDLLEPAERDLFAKLAVFAGGGSLPAAVAVCDATDEAVLALADRSLLRTEESVAGVMRFRMLETVREYALERLEQSDDSDVVHRRHAQFFAALADDAGAALWSPVQGPERALWLDRLDLDHDNLRAALAWSDVNDRELQLRIAAGLIDFWLMRCHFDEGRRMLERALAGAPDGDAPTRAKALHAAAFLASSQGEFARCDALGEASLELYRALGDDEGVGRTVHLLSQNAAYQGDLERATVWAEESLALARSLDHSRGQIVSLGNLGRLATQHGDYDRAEALLAEGRRLARQHGDESALAAVCHSESMLARARGDRKAATTFAIQGVDLYTAYGTIAGAAECLHVLALLAEEIGEPERAVLLLGAVNALREQLGSPPPPADSEDADAALERARKALGEAAADAAWAAGRAVAPDQLTALARADESRVPTAGSTRPR